MKTADLLALVRQPGKCYVEYDSRDNWVHAFFERHPSGSVIEKERLKLIILAWPWSETITVTQGAPDSRGHCTKTFQFSPR